MYRDNGRKFNLPIVQAMTIEATMVGRRSNLKSQRIPEGRSAGQSAVPPVYPLRL